MVEKAIKNIVVAIDGSQPSMKGLRRAIYLAGLSGATITGVGVVTVYPTLAATVINYRKYLTKKFEEFLESAQKQAEKEGVKFKSKVLRGTAASEIVKFSKRESCDLLVIGSRGRGKIKSKILGSIANSVVQKADVPVLVVK